MEVPGNRWNCHIPKNGAKFSSRASDLYVFFVGMAPILSKSIPINTIGSCKVTKDDKLMEHDALRLVWFFDSYYPGFTGDDPKETLTWWVFFLVLFFLFDHIGLLTSNVLGKYSLVQWILIFPENVTYALVIVC